MNKFPVTPTIIVKEDDHGSLAFWKWPRKNYATNLFIEHGIEHVYLDFGTIRNRDEWIPENWPRIRQWLDTHGYAEFDLRGHGQNAKTGMMPLIRREQRHMFEKYSDAIRLGGLMGPALYYGVQKKRNVRILLVTDDWPGCGDGYVGCNWLKTPFQFRATAFIGTQFHEGFGIKGQIGPTVYIPEGIDMVVPISTAKGPILDNLKQTVKEEAAKGDLAEFPAFTLNVLRIGYMSQAQKNSMRMGYMVAQHWPDYIFEAMEEDVIAAAQRVTKFKEDPLSYLPEEIVDSEDEEVQGTEAVLPQYAKYVLRTGDKSLLYTKTIARIVQNQIAQMSQDAILTGGVRMLSAVAMPIPAGMTGKLGTIYLNPKMMGPFRATGIAGVVRHPYANENNGVKVNVEESPLVPLLNDAGEEVRNVCFIQDTLKVTGVDFDMDALGLLSVPSINSWQMMVCDRWATLPPPPTDGERMVNPIPPQSYMEAYCNAAGADIGRITNLKSRLAAARQHVDESWLEEIRKMDDKLSIQQQAAVDQAKWGLKPDKKVIQDAGDLLKKLNEIPEDYAYIRLLGNKPERSWAFDKMGRFNPKPGDRISPRTALGRHVLKHQDLIPNAGVVVKANAFYKAKMKERLGPGYDAGVLLWKEMGNELSIVAKAGYGWDEARERRADIGKWWMSVWTELAEGDRQFMEQAISACWSMAFGDDESNQNRLWSTHLPTIFRLLEEDLPRPTTGDVPKEEVMIQGRLIGIGMNKLQSDTVMKVLGIREDANARGEVHQYALTPDNPEMGWMVVGASLPDDYKGLIRVKPLWLASSKFQTW